MIGCFNIQIFTKKEKLKTKLSLRQKWLEDRKLYRIQHQNFILNSFLFFSFNVRGVWKLQLLFLMRQSYSELTSNFWYFSYWDNHTNDKWFYPDSWLEVVKQNFSISSFLLSRPFHRKNCQVITWVIISFHFIYSNSISAPQFSS